MVAGCGYKTSPPLEYADAKQERECHMKVVHPPVVPPPPPVEGERRQVEKIKRPTLTYQGKTLDEQAVELFKFEFDEYKARVPEANTAGQLRECLGADVRDTLFSSYGTGLGKLSRLYVQRRKQFRPIGVSSTG